VIQASCCSAAGAAGPVDQARVLVRRLAGYMNRCADSYRLGSAADNLLRNTVRFKLGRTRPIRDLERIRHP
jgi:hypothetical protein